MHLQSLITIPHLVIIVYHVKLLKHVARDIALFIIKVVNNVTHYVKTFVKVYIVYPGPFLQSINTPFIKIDLVVKELRWNKKHI